ncbi:MAG TPA: PHP domain-containing protein [Desulfuromonadaceae bacterium]|jgi:hypothetical protein
MATDKKKYIDLHMHSNYSDGVFSPTELVEQAKSEDLTAIALADHDSLTGIPEALQAGAKQSIEVIPAVELSVQFGRYKDVHLLGYGIDYTNKNFLERLNAFRERRERRNMDILERVNESLVIEKRQVIPLNEVLAHARDAIGRPHIARALLERRYVANVEEAFRRYLIPCNVPKQYWSIKEAITEIRSLGGAAVLAHPTTITNDQQKLCSILKDLAEMGLDGIEVFNNMAFPLESEYLRRAAQELGLIVTGGSDFHGIEEGLKMGRGRGGMRFSANLLPPLRSLLLQRN